MFCILCVQVSQQVIYIFQDEGVALNAYDIITKHLWLQPNENDVNRSVICHSCWSALNSFHTFCLQIEEAHIRQQELNICTQIESTIKLEDNDCVDDAISIKLEAKDVFENPQSTYIIFELEENIKDSANQYSNKSNECDTGLTFSTRSQKPSLSQVHQDSDLEPNNDGNDSDWKTSTRQGKEFKKHRKSKLTKKDIRKKKQSLKKYANKYRKKKKSIENPQNIDRDELIAKNVKLSCNVCSLVLPTFSILLKHYRSEHNQHGYATCCGIKFFKRCTICDHINRHQNPEFFKCKQCGKVLSTRQNLNIHLTTHNTTQRSRSYQCHLCTFSFYTNALLKRHLHTHVSGRNVKCSQCDKFFSTELLMRRHMHSVHKSKTRICDQCGVLFVSVSALRQHQMEHTDIFQNFKKGQPESVNGIQETAEKFS